MSKSIYLKYVCEMNIGTPYIHRSGSTYALVYFLRLRPTSSLSVSLLFETGRYTYIHSSSFFSLHFLYCFSLLFPFSPFPSRSFQTSIGEKYIFVHRARNHHRRLSPRPLHLIPCSPLIRTHSYIFPAALIHCIRSEVHHEARFSP